MSDGGKGSSPRPFSVNQETYAANYAAIFGHTPDCKEQDVNNGFQEGPIRESERQEGRVA